MDSAFGPKHLNHNGPHKTSSSKPGTKKNFTRYAPFSRSKIGSWVRGKILLFNRTVINEVSIRSSSSNTASFQLNLIGVPGGTPSIFNIERSIFGVLKGNIGSDVSVFFRRGKDP